MGHVGATNRTVYCMTKHTVEGLTKAMAIELAPHRIRGNSVGPTLVETPLARRSVDTPEKRAYFESRIAPDRLASIKDHGGDRLSCITSSGRGNGRASSGRRRLDRAVARRSR
jgi:NAD(P)-dependent dehydrogenase (short-subunit alcohol dehydrogenase family)